MTPKKRSADEDRSLRLREIQTVMFWLVWHVALPLRTAEKMIEGAPQLIDVLLPIAAQEAHRSMVAFVALIDSEIVLHEQRKFGRTI